MDAWLLSLATSWVVYPGMFVFALIDGFFPPMPSEVAAVGLTALAASTGSPDLALVVLVAAAGAFVGDLVAYGIGARIDVHRMPLLRRGRGAQTLAWAERSLTHRGRSFILAGRFVPVARVAVSMSAGALGYPRRSFMLLAGIGSTTWAAYSAVLGAGAGAWFAGHPGGAVVVGTVGGLVLGVVLDLVLSRVQHVRGRSVAPASVAEPG
ncbi:VTT domain-containing protein [Isoptericola sp. b490]|uniref:DedA family protein n=1 Tax=Actinotalea lenta TaxID=3064654 RepID=UPI002714067D|nr:VTT domain-containing protein [Isoptericola sp. b490]MDO8120036.1 VTT domain-containing protein [Isoptericola sp. b490]